MSPAMSILALSPVSWWRDKLRSFLLRSWGGRASGHGPGGGESAGRVTGLLLFLFCGPPATADFPRCGWRPTSAPQPQLCFLLCAQQTVQNLSPTELRWSL